MSDDHVRLHMEAPFVSVSASLVFCVNSVQKMCSSASYRIKMKTRILGSFTFMHLADAFIQSDLQYIQVIHMFLRAHIFY